MTIEEMLEEAFRHVAGENSPTSYHDLTRCDVWRVGVEVCRRLDRIEALLKLGGEAVEEDRGREIEDMGDGVRRTRGEEGLA